MVSAGRGPKSPLPPCQLPLPPPAPRNLGPRPADTIVNEPVLGLGRTHTIVTPQRTEVIPQLDVNKYQVDVPVPVPTPVERTVIVEKPVQKPYTVDVPVPVRVEKPYPVHQVKHIVETPVIEKRTYTHVQPVAVTKTVGVAHVAHAAPVAAVGAVAAPAAVGAIAAPAAVGGVVAAPAGIAGVAGYGLAGGYGLAAPAWAGEAVVAAEH